MKKLSISIGLFLGLFAQAQNWNSEEQYIQRFATIAVEQMEKYKIPASITLAQGLIETGGGQSRLAQEGNNHFGIKCKSDWTGKSMRHDDDAPQECFRVYDSPAQSYEDHSLFLATREYYKKLFELDIHDYRGWAHGLKKAGYATNSRYAPMLLSKIEKYQLQEFDYMKPADVYAALLKKYPALSDDSIFMAKLQQDRKTDREKKAVTLRVPYQPTSFAKTLENVQKVRVSSYKDVINSILVKNHPNGDLKYIVVPEDMDIELISKKFDIPVNKLQRWNELDKNTVRRNDILFLEPKNFEGNIEKYTTVMGDTMHAIAQKFAVRVEKLYSKNNYQPGTQPPVGEVIYLKGKKPKA